MNLSAQIGSHARFPLPTLAAREDGWGKALPALLQSEVTSGSPGVSGTPWQLSVQAVKLLNPRGVPFARNSELTYQQKGDALRARRRKY